MDPRRWQEIRATFDALVELDVVERGNRLTALSSSDLDLRAAVEALLVVDAEVDERLAPLDAAFSSQSVATADPLGIAGRTISHFRVHEAVGAGGMGVVYRADDTRLGRPVALKFLLPSYSLDAGAKARFLREAHSAAALDHPNLCSIYEIGTSEDGRLFLAMAFYEGVTLKSRLARVGSIPAGEALAIARQVAEGLRGAHAAGTVHRDLKPGNVMLLPDGNVKILDFGLAKARDQSLSETGARFGTVSYMSPEQIRGQAVDGRADLWALGVILYEMLTGRKPFAGEHDIAVAHAILHDEPQALSAPGKDTSPALEDFVLQLLQKDPAKRDPTASELLADLARVQIGARGLFASMRTHWRRVRRGLPLPTPRTMAVGGALLVGGALGFTAFTRNGANNPPVAARTALAVLPFRNLSADGPNAYFAGGLHDEILSQLYKVPAITVVGRSSVMSYSGPNTPPLRQIARELGVGSVVEGSVQVVADRVRVTVQLMDAATDAPLWVERYDRTLNDAFALESDIAQQVVATVGAALSTAERDALVKVPTAKAEAYLLYLRGREYQLRPGLLRDNLEAAQPLY